MTLFVDITDLMHYFRFHQEVSGLQRVVCELARQLVEQHKVCPVQLVAFSGAGHYVHVPDGILSDGLRPTPREIARLINTKARKRAKRPRWYTPPMLHSYIVSLFRSKPAAIAYSDRILVAGGSWGNINLLDHLETLRAGGVRVSQIVYDLIPHRTPQYCADGLPAKFSAWLDRSPHYVSDYFTISEFVK